MEYHVNNAAIEEALNHQESGFYLESIDYQKEVN